MAAAKLAEQEMVIRAETMHMPNMCQGNCDGKGCCWKVHVKQIGNPYDTQLAVGLDRLTQYGTWNQWQWAPRHPAFYDLDSFRCVSCPA